MPSLRHALPARCGKSSKAYLRSLPAVRRLRLREIARSSRLSSARPSLRMRVSGPLAESNHLMKCRRCPAVSSSNSLARREILFQRQPQVGGHRLFSRHAVQSQFHADHVANIGARRFAQRSIELDAITSAARRHQRNPRAAPIHIRDNRNVFRPCALGALARRFSRAASRVPLAASKLRDQRSRDSWWHVHVPHDPDLVNCCNKRPGLAIRRHGHIVQRAALRLNRANSGTVITLQGKSAAPSYPKAARASRN